MTTIKVAHQKGWCNLWLECDPKLTIEAFDNPSLLPWRLRNRWQSCLFLTRRMHFQVSHIYREGNYCADELAAFVLSSRISSWWDLVPACIWEDFNCNKLGLRKFRFS